MKLSEVKKSLGSIDELIFRMESGVRIPERFHVTEIGKVSKHFIDCGGTIRKESLISFQLWEGNDFGHRLKPSKLLQIIELSESKLAIQDDEVEVEYQGETIGKYALVFDGKNFILKNKNTACLASDACGIPVSVENEKSVCCSPNSTCC